MTDRSADHHDRPRRAPSPAAPHPPPPPAPPPRFERRQVLVAGAAATGLAGVALYTSDKLLGGKPASTTRPAAERASDGGAFADRDDSFARTAAPAPAASEPLPTNVYRTASEAAAATEVTVPTILATDDPVLHLLRRATFGPTPALVDEVHEMGIDGWLEQQLDPSSIDDAVADGVWAALPLAGMSPGEIQRSTEKYSWDAMFAFGQATLGRQIWSKRQLFEVMVDFWSDHLHVALPGAGWDVGGSYYLDVIREHALGSFTEMLLAAMQHPAMLRYLSNTESDKDAVNENLGRELLELHTVGVGAGYTEDDVRNSAYILTGRTEISQYDAEQGRGQAGTYVYDPGKHWTGAVKVLDFQHANAAEGEGFDVGEAYLTYLAKHPATARTIARKLVVRFVSDDPPDSLVDRLATTFAESDNEIVPVLDVLFRSAELWAAVGQKTKRPLENLVASVRAVDAQPGPDVAAALESLYWSSHNMGHQPLAWPAPDGYADVHAAWRSAGGLVHTWRFHLSLTQDWNDALGEIKAEELIGDRPQGTVGEYVDSLCERLCLQRFQAPHRDALLAFVGADAGTPADQSDLPHVLDHLAGLVLDAPYFALR